MSVKCECSGRYSHASKKQHFLTRLHINYFKQFEITTTKDNYEEKFNDVEQKLIIETQLNHLLLKRIEKLKNTEMLLMETNELCKIRFALLSKRNDELSEKIVEFEVYQHLLTKKKQNKKKNQRIKKLNKCVEETEMEINNTDEANETEKNNTDETNEMVINDTDQATDIEINDTDEGTDMEINDTDEGSVTSDTNEAIDTCDRSDDDDVIYKNLHFDFVRLPNSNEYNIISLSLIRLYKTNVVFREMFKAYRTNKICIRKNLHYDTNGRINSQLHFTGFIYSLLNRSNTMHFYLNSSNDIIGITKIQNLLN